MKKASHRINKKGFAGWFGSCAQVRIKRVLRLLRRSTRRRGRHQEDDVLLLDADPLGRRQAALKLAAIVAPWTA